MGTRSLCGPDLCLASRVLKWIRVRYMPIRGDRKIPIEAWKAARCPSVPPSLTLDQDECVPLVDLRAAADLVRPACEFYFILYSISSSSSSSSGGTWWGACASC
jgi:hypothetical protein